MTRKIARLVMNGRDADTFISAVYSQERVSGLTHDFYKYPARFSPQLCKAAIESVYQSWRFGCRSVCWRGNSAR